MRRPSLLLPATLVAVLAAASPAAAQTDGAWTCEASALRGTVLGTSIEPVVANVLSGPCRTARQGLADINSLPLPVKATAVTAGTLLTGDAGAATRDRGALAVGSLTGLRLQALPELPVVIPIEPLLVNVPTLNVLGISLDLEPAVRALLPDGTLPAVDLLSLDKLSASAAGACVDGQARTHGSSQVAGLRVLGQPIGTDQAVSQVLNLLNTTSIDPSNLDLSKIELPVGLGVLLPLVQAALQPALDALPPIEIPAALAHVAVTPGEQLRGSDGSLTQRALRVQASLLGQPLLDLVLGEAAVGQSGVDCAAGAGTNATATELALGCTKRKLTLIDVVPDGGRVRLLGAADKSLAGEEVDIVFQATNDVVASPVVRPDGSFSATAPMPSRRQRASDEARYVAKAGRERSMNLKLARRMRVTGLRSADGFVTIAGRVTGPLARRAKDREVVLTRRLTCKRWEVVARGMPAADGTFRLRVKAPEDAAAAVYRLRSKVQKTTRNPKLFATFTLPRAVSPS